MRSGLFHPDDRGHLIEVVTPARIRNRSEHPDDEHRVAAAAHLSGMRRDAMGGVNPMGRLLTPICIFAFIFIVFRIFDELDLTDLWMLPVLLAGIVLIVAVSRKNNGGMRASGISATVVSRGYCGACGYTLEGLAACEHGLVTCPECGAAWNAAPVSVTRIRTPSPLPETKTTRLPLGLRRLH